MTRDPALNAQLAHTMQFDFPGINAPINTIHEIFVVEEDGSFAVKIGDVNVNPLDFIKLFTYDSQDGFVQASLSKITINGKTYAVAFGSVAHEFWQAPGDRTTNGVHVVDGYLFRVARTMKDPSYHYFFAVRFTNADGQDGGSQKYFVKSTLDYTIRQYDLRPIDQ